jgi:hypothetical protein
MFSHSGSDSIELKGLPAIKPYLKRGMKSAVQRSKLMILVPRILLAAKMWPTPQGTSLQVLAEVSELLLLPQYLGDSSPYYWAVQGTT